MNQKLSIIIASAVIGSVIVVNVYVVHKVIAYVNWQAMDAKIEQAEREISRLQDESQYERSLPPDEQKKLREKKYEYALRAVSRKNTESIESGRNSYERRWKSIGNPDVIAVIGKEDGIYLPMSSEESENGDAEYYLDGSGNKMFS